MRRTSEAPTKLAGEPLSPFDFLRYLSNTAAPLSVLAGLAVGAVAKRREWRPWPYRGAVLALLLYLVWCANTSMVFRREMIAIETKERRDPAISAIRVAEAFGNRYPIVTLEPLVVQIYGTEKTSVISLPFLTPEMMEAAGTVLYLRQDRYESDVDRERYSSGFAALESQQDVVMRRGDGWTIRRVTVADRR